MKNKLGNTPVHRDSIFPFLQVNEDDGYVKGTDYKFNRMLVLDENYTLVAVKYLPKLKAKISNRPSVRVRDYIDWIKDLEDFLEFMIFERDNYLINFLLKDYAAFKIVNEMIQY